MKNLIHRIKNSVVLAVWAFKNPDTMQAANFKMLSDFLSMILKVANEHRPIMTKIGFVHPSEGKQAIVSIWAGPSMKADPTERISELIQENELLKLKVAELVKSNTEKL